MLQAAVMRKSGKSQSRIARRLGRSQKTIGDWLRRFRDTGGPEGRYDRKSPGRPCRLSAEQRAWRCPGIYPGSRWRVGV